MWQIEDIFSSRQTIVIFVLMESFFPVEGFWNKKGIVVSTIIFKRRFRQHTCTSRPRFPYTFWRLGLKLVELTVSWGSCKVYHTVPFYHVGYVKSVDFSSTFHERMYTNFGPEIIIFCTMYLGFKMIIQTVVECGLFNIKVQNNAWTCTIKLLAINLYSLWC